MLTSGSRIGFADVDIWFTHLEYVITDVDFELQHYGCRHLVEAFELRMSTSSSFFFQLMVCGV